MTDAEILDMARALIADFRRNHTLAPPMIPTVAGYWATVRAQGAALDTGQRAARAAADAARLQVSGHLPHAVRAAIHRQIVGSGCVCPACQEAWR